MHAVEEDEWAEFKSPPLSDKAGVSVTDGTSETSGEGHAAKPKAFASGVKEACVDPADSVNKPLFDTLGIEIARPALGGKVDVSSRKNAGNATETEALSSKTSPALSELDASAGAAAGSTAEDNPRSSVYAAPTTTESESVTLRSHSSDEGQNVEGTKSRSADSEPRQSPKPDGDVPDDREDWGDFEQPLVTAPTDHHSPTRSPSSGEDAKDPKQVGHSSDDMPGAVRSEEQVGIHPLMQGGPAPAATLEPTHHGTTWASTSHGVWRRSSEHAAQAAEKVDGDWRGSGADADIIPDAKDASKDLSSTSTDNVSHKLAPVTLEQEQGSGSSPPHGLGSKEQPSARSPDIPSSSLHLACVDPQRVPQNVKDGNSDRAIAFQVIHEGREPSESATDSSKSEVEAVEPDERIAGDSTLVPTRTGGPEAAKVTAAAGNQVEACPNEDDAWSTAVTVDANEEDFGDLGLLPTGPEVPAIAEHEDMGNDYGAGPREGAAAARGASPTKMRELELRPTSRLRGLMEEMKGPRIEPFPLMTVDEASSFPPVQARKPSVLNTGESKLPVKDEPGSDWVKFDDAPLPVGKDAPEGAEAAPAPLEKEDDVSPPPPSPPPEPAGGDDEDDDDWGAFLETPEAPSSATATQQPERDTKAADTMASSEPLSTVEETAGVASPVPETDASAEHGQTSRASGDEAVAAGTAAIARDGDAMQGDEDWGDFGDFEEAPTPSPPEEVEASAGIGKLPREAGATSPAGAERQKASSTSQSASGWGAFEDSEDDGEASRAADDGAEGSKVGMELTS